MQTGDSLNINPLLFEIEANVKLKPGKLRILALEPLRRRTENVNVWEANGYAKLIREGYPRDDIEFIRIHVEVDVATKHSVLTIEDWVKIEFDLPKI